MGIIRSLKTFIKMGCESDSFGSCVLSLDSYSGRECLGPYITHISLQNNNRWLYKIHTQVTPMETIQPGDWTKGTVRFVYSEEMGVYLRAPKQREVGYPHFPLGQVEAGRVQSSESFPAARHPPV